MFHIFTEYFATLPRMQQTSVEQSNSLDLATAGWRLTFKLFSIVWQCFRLHVWHQGPYWSINRPLVSNFILVLIWWKKGKTPWDNCAEIRGVAYMGFIHRNDSSKCSPLGQIFFNFRLQKITCHPSFAVKTKETEQKCVCHHSHTSIIPWRKSIKR